MSALTQELVSGSRLDDAVWDAMCELIEPLGATLYRTDPGYGPERVFVENAFGQVLQWTDENTEHVLAHAERGAKEFNVLMGRA